MKKEEYLFMKSSKLKTVDIYTDGACSGNPGVGGWAAVLMHKTAKKEISGAEPITTNNRMELLAVINALAKVKEKCNINLHSDSAYVVNAFLKGWTDKWKLNGWRSSDKKEVKNKDMWQKLLNLTVKHNIKWIKVKGHSDNKYNNRCDELAKAAIEDYINLNKQETINEVPDIKPAN